MDKWIVYGTVDGNNSSTRRGEPSSPAARSPSRTTAYELIVTQGRGSIGKVEVSSPNFIRFGEMTEDEVFVTAKRAAEGVAFKNLSGEPFVSLRYYGPDVHKSVPNVGDYLKAR